MTDAEKCSVQEQIRLAYKEDSPIWAAYLELCLKVDDPPRVR